MAVKTIISLNEEICDPLGYTEGKEKSSNECRHYPVKSLGLVQFKSYQGVILGLSFINVETNLII